MHANLQEDFTINGIKSWIHCLYRHLESGSKPQQALYHYHNYIEFLYALSSDANVWVNGECHHFTTGDLAIINSDVPHDVTSNGTSDYICIKFSPNVLYADEQAFLEFKYLLPFLTENCGQIIYHKDEIQNIDLLTLTNEIMNEWDNQSPAYELVIRANILKIFAEIIRINHQRNNTIPELNITDTMKKAAIFIHKNFSSVTEKEVADECGLSYNHFSFLFKKTFRKSFNDYLTQIKLREAEKLLILTDKSITEIAYEIGFSTASYFVARFKQINLITPSKFRKKIRESEMICTPFVTAKFETKAKEIRKC